ARGCICQSAYYFGTRLRRADALFGRRTSHPRPVGQYPANLFGLHDVHGTIWEWVADWYDEAYYRRSPEADPPGPRDASRRGLRGRGVLGAQPRGRPPRPTRRQPARIARGGLEHAGQLVPVCPAGAQHGQRPARLQRLPRLALGGGLVMGWLARLWQTITGQK